MGQAYSCEKVEAVLATEFWKTVTADHSGFLEVMLDTLRDTGTSYCVIGGVAVNAYTEPVVTLDLDLALAPGQAERLVALLPARIRSERFAHSINLEAPGSELRVQLQTDPRYESFPLRAREREVLGLTLPVASVEDVLQGKIWAVSDETRRASKRQKDLADIARLLEARPDLRESVPRGILDRLIE